MANKKENALKGERKGRGDSANPGYRFGMSGSLANHGGGEARKSGSFWPSRWHYLPFAEIRPRHSA